MRRKPALRYLLSCICLLAAAVASWAHAPIADGAPDSVLVAPFVKGDRAVFVGNSITHSGHYHSYIWLYYMTRFPAMPITVVNAGIGGDTAREMLRRFDADIMHCDPTVLMFTFGMNDSGFASEVNKRNRATFADSKYSTAVQYFDKIVDNLNELPARIVMVGSSPYDEHVAVKAKPLKGKNATMQRIIDYQHQVAVQNGWEFVDFNRPIADINLREQHSDPAFSLSGPHDRIHPDNDGDMVMAYLFLKAQGFAGREVASVNIDAGAQRLVSANNCRIANLQVRPDGVEYDYQAFALPYPADTEARAGKVHSQSEGLCYVPFTDEMNQEVLRVTGLTGKYKLYIDGHMVTRTDGDQLAQGLNLAALTNTPQYRQAQEVMRLNEERWRIEYSYRKYRWCVHTYMFNKDFRDDPPAQAAEAMYGRLGRKGYLPSFVDAYVEWTDPDKARELQQRMDELVEQCYAKAQPQIRHIRIVKE